MTYEIKENYFAMRDKFYKRVSKPTGRMILVNDPENGQDYVMGYKDDLFEISKEEYQKKVGTK
jgi:hypothetical protein|tara:strand:+ start:472 stop:660 length:189 start_codon:yes stop_codon:yes gene_type:complete